MCAAIDHALTSVVITSSSSGEGKTDLAWRLGYAMARDNRRVIIVDANLRNPELHELANVGIRPGLTDVLLGENTLDEVLHETGAPGLRILTAGSEIANPGDLLLSNNMRVLHEELKLRADLVIFDSPPCLDTADANVLAHLADSVLYITSKGSSRTALRSGIKMLRQAQGKLLGVITRDPHVTSKALARKGR
jgi:capsular exopolysaccharide synthesis family protein